VIIISADGLYNPTDIAYILSQSCTLSSSLGKHRPVATSLQHDHDAEPRHWPGSTRCRTHNLLLGKFLSARLQVKAHHLNDDSLDS